MSSSLILFSTVVALLTTSLTATAADVEIAAVPATSSVVATRPRSLYRACKADLTRLCTPKRTEGDNDSGSERRKLVSPAAAYKCLEQRTSELEEETCKAWIAGRQTCLADVRPKLSQCTAAVRAVAMREERLAARESALLQKAMERARLEGAAEPGAGAEKVKDATNGTASARAEAGRKQVARVDRRVASLVGNATARVRPEVLMRCLRELPESAIGAACTATDFYSSFAMFKADRRGSRSREFRGRVGKRDFLVPSADATAAAKAAAVPPVTPAVVAEKPQQPAAADQQAARASKKEKLANLIAAALDVAVDEKAGDTAKVVVTQAAAADTTAAPVAAPVGEAAEKVTAAEQIEAAPVEATATVPAVEKVTP